MLVILSTMLYNKLNIFRLGCQCLLIEALRNNYGFADILIMLLSSLAVIFITLPIHEWAHGFVSTKLGDPTPRYQGRLTLNPMAHFDPMGALGILLLGIGWAKPVQVNARYYKNPKWGMALVALAGPLANIILAFVMLLINNILLLTGLVEFAIIEQAYYFLLYIAIISIGLAVFNLIPIPPFDGSRILFVVLPQRIYFQIMRYERYIFIGIFILVYSGLLDRPLDFLNSQLFDVLYYLAWLPFKLLGV